MATGIGKYKVRTYQNTMTDFLGWARYNLKPTVVGWTFKPNSDYSNEEIPSILDEGELLRIFTEKVVGKIKVGR